MGALNWIISIFGIVSQSDIYRYKKLLHNNRKHHAKIYNLHENICKPHPICRNTENT